METKELSCSKCKQPKENDGKAMCKTCRAARTAKAKKQAEARQAAGLCPTCGGAMDRKGYQCGGCLEDYYTRTANKSRKLKKQGLCSKCGKEVETSRIILDFSEFGVTFKDIIREEDLSVSYALEEGVSIPTRTIKDDHCAKCQQLIHISNLTLKEDVIKKIGDKCFCCGEIELQFLNVFPKDGSRFRAIFSLNWEHSINSWIFEHGIPLSKIKEKFWVVCQNCHESLEIYKNCPHQTNFKATHPLI